MNRAEIVEGDALAVLRTMEAESVQCVVTSPPYWGLRDYGTAGQLGLEATPAAYVAAMVEVFREVRRVLRKDGTLWLNLGDSYAGSWGAQGRDGEMSARAVVSARQVAAARRDGARTGSLERTPGLKPKDLVGIPWRVAFALQSDGWWLRSDIVWAKPNPMPESVRDRPTRSHEYLFLLTRSARYYYDADAISTPAAPSSVERLSQPTLDEQAGSSRANGGAKTNGPMKAVFGGRNKHEGYGNRKASGNEDEGRYVENGVNARSVWTIATTPFSGARLGVRGVSGGIGRTASPDCPVHGDRSTLDATAEHDGPPTAFHPDRNRDSGDHHAPELSTSPAPTQMLLGADCARGSLGSTTPEYAPTATPRSMGSRRMDLAPETSTHGIDGEGSSSRTVGRPPQSDCDAMSSHNRESRTGPDCGADGPPTHRGEETTSDTARTCTCRNNSTPADHFAVFPPEIPRRCILAGSRPGDLVLDPFAGAGTTLLVAHRLGRDSIGIELSPAYCALARERIRSDAPLFAP